MFIAQRGNLFEHFRVLLRHVEALAGVVFQVKELRRIVVDWTADPLAGGCYSVIGPGQRRALASLAAPIGRLHLAGEHVNGSGTIDGAIRTGEDAARSVSRFSVF